MVSEPGEPQMTGGGCERGGGAGSTNTTPGLYGCLTKYKFQLISGSVTDWFTWVVLQRDSKVRFVKPLGK